MQSIKMVDLGGQHKKIESELKSAMQEVMDTTAFIKGPQVTSFESNLAKYLGVKHVISCGNGTDAIQIALMALELQPGDEVITPDFTFVATAEVVRILGLKPILVDIDPKTFNISPDSIRKAITPKTKVIIPVHLFGQCADMDEIAKIAQEHNLYIVEDNAQAIGSSWCTDILSGKSGTIGNIGCTSFFPSKNLGCAGDGGAIFTNDDDLAMKIKSIANHGQKDMYYYQFIGVNSRLDSLQAALLNIKLSHLDEYNAKRKWAASKYDELLKNVEGIEIPFREKRSDHVFHQYTLIVKNGKRDALIAHLNGLGIPNKVYYPVPLHLNHPYDKECAFDPLRLENTNYAAKSVLSLPMHTELDMEQIEFITKNIKEFLAA